MFDIVYGVWLPTQRPPGWWIDATGAPFHSVHRCVAEAMLHEKKTVNDGYSEVWSGPMTVEVIGPDGLPMSDDVLPAT